MGNLLRIQTTWLENHVSAFNRVVVFDFDPLQDSIPYDYIAGMLHDDLGLNETIDYVFDPFERTREYSPPSTDGRVTIRVKEEEHFIMLRLHYDGN